MAYTEIHEIYATVNKAVDYIVDFEKSQGLVSTFACTVQNADKEFETIRDLGHKGKVKARHIIQSFSPDDNLTPEQAHEIAKEMMNNLYGEKYQFVIATHIDKAHIHNHIIFNSTSLDDYKKFRSPKSAYFKIQKESDRLCEKYNLSIIENNHEHKIKSKNTKFEKQKTESNRNKLKKIVDTEFKKSKSLDEFLEALEKNGIEIKKYGKIKENKYIAIKFPEQKKYTRLVTFDEKYSTEFLETHFKNKSFNYFIRKDINEAIYKSKNYDEVLTFLTKKGYTINTTGKYHTIKSKEMQRARRFKTLGDDYSEEAIKKRIEENLLSKSEAKAKFVADIKKQNENLKSQIDNSKQVRYIDKSDDKFNSAGLSKWASANNVKAILNATNTVAKYKADINNLGKDIDETKSNVAKLNDEIKEINKSVVQLNIARDKLKELYTIKKDKTIIDKIKTIDKQLQQFEKINENKLSKYNFEKQKFFDLSQAKRTIDEVDKSKNKSKNKDHSI